MILLQLSAGQGPIECCHAVGLALQAIEKQSKDSDIRFGVIDMVKAKQVNCYKSVLIQLEHNSNKDKAKQFAASWQGAMLWICPSLYRPKHKRKNWFFSGRMYEVDEMQLDKQITFQACRASGAGGQHVNNTDSAIRATHTATGVSVRVENERSQHANKRLARALIFKKLESTRVDNMSEQERSRWLQHWQVQRGNPSKKFSGRKFIPT